MLNECRLKFEESEKTSSPRVVTLVEIWYSYTFLLAEWAVIIEMNNLGKRDGTIISREELQ